MYELTVENYLGEQLQITQNPKYTVISVDGFTMPNVNVIMNASADGNGSIYNASHIHSREITIRLKIEGNVDENRIYLYKFFTPNNQLRLYYRNRLRDVFIDGYTESMQGSLHDNPETFIISVLCPECYLYDNGLVTTSKEGYPLINKEPEIEFFNDSDLDCGLEFEMINTNYTMSPKILLNETGEYFELTYELPKNVKLKIGTIRNRKYCVAETSDGSITNLLHYITNESTWLQAHPGNNKFIIYTSQHYGYKYSTTTLKCRKVHLGV